jgi:hypothetical protein
MATLAAFEAGPGTSVLTTGSVASPGNAGMGVEGGLDTKRTAQARGTFSI